jgi:uncharacterized protein with von Willebrand factor type A (vWA) domain
MTPGQLPARVEPEEIQGTLFGDDLDVGQTGPLISEVPVPADKRPGPIRWLHASAHDRLVWDRLLADSELLAGTADETVARLPTAESLLADLWVCYYRADVRWIPGAGEDGRTAAHRPILERLLASPAHARIRPAVNGREELAALAADATLRRIAAAIEPEVAEFLALEEEFFKRRDEIEAERQSIADLIARKVRARKPVITDKPNAPETLTISERKERDAELEVELALLDHDRLADPKAIRMRAELRNSLSRAIEGGRVGEIADRLEEYDAASAAWGDDPADPMRLPIDERLALFRRFCDDPKLRSATAMLGRLRNRAAGAHRALTPAAPARIAGIRLGDDLSRLLPAETALAAEPLLASEFERRYAESELATYRIEERAEPERGPVVVCLDESSSMEGDREIAAKAAALAVLQVAADDGREGALIEFADAEHLRVTRWGARERNPVATADVLGHFWGGGTDFSAPLAAALELIEGERRLAGADLLMVTDGDASISDEVRDRVVAARDGELGVRLFVVAVGTDPGPLEPIAERVWRIDELTNSGTDELVDELVAAVHPGGRT